MLSPLRELRKTFTCALSASQAAAVESHSACYVCDSGNALASCRASLVHMSVSHGAQAQQLTEA